MTLRDIAALSTIAVVALAGPSAPAEPTADPAAAAAEAYGLLVDAQLLPSAVAVREGPVSWAAHEYPFATAEPSEAAVVEAGPTPGDGSVVTSLGVLTATAQTNGVPDAVAAAQVENVALLGTTVPVTADSVRAQATSDCTDDPNGTGTTFANLRVNGLPVDSTPDPNTVIDLGVAKVILNEQHPAYDGRGIIVNAIHVVSTTSGDALFRGDVIVAHARTTVSCPGGAGTTGEAGDLSLAMDASPETAAPETEVTYRARVTNAGQDPILVIGLIAHLAVPFEFVSTEGDFGTEPDRTETRPGGGTDVAVGNGTLVPAGETFQQLFVVSVKADAAPATYASDLEVLAANLGNHFKGLGTPVQVADELAAATPQCSDGIDNDEDGLTDYPDDPGCQSPDDDDETNPEVENRNASRLPNTGNRLPSTGGPTPLYLLGTGLLALSLGAHRLRKVS